MRLLLAAMAAVLLLLPALALAFDGTYYHRQPHHYTHDKHYYYGKHRRSCDRPRYYQHQSYHHQSYHPWRYGGREVKKIIYVEPDRRFYRPYHYRPYHYRPHHPLRFQHDRYQPPKAGLYVDFR